MLTTWQCRHVPVTAAAIDPYLLPVPAKSTAANLRGLFLWVHARRDRQIDTVPLQRPSTAYYVGSVNKQGTQRTWQSTHGNMSSLKLLSACLPTMTTASCIHSSIRQPAGSHYHTHTHTCQHLHTVMSNCIVPSVFNNISISH